MAKASRITSFTTNDVATSHYTAIVLPHSFGLIRPAGPRDAGTLERVAQRTFRDAFSADIPAADMQRILTERFSGPAMEPMLADPQQRWLLAVHGDEPIGYAATRPRPAPGTPGPVGAPALELARLYVEQPWQGKGVAAELLRRCLEDATDRRFGRCWLQAYEHNPRALAFYRKHGFEDDGHATVNVGGLSLRHIVMVRRLIATAGQGWTTPAAPPSIRRATPADASGIAAFALDVFNDTFAWCNTRENMLAYTSVALTAEAFAEAIGDRRCELWLAETDRALQGYAMLRTGDAISCVSGPAPIELARLYVRRTHHGQGVAATLMQHCFQRCRELGYRTWWLGVWEHNYRALAFYQRWGFRPVGAKVFQLGDDPQIDIVMTREV